ncbi:MAG: hypothetical protein COT15_01775 [Candidatus Diapherotrites archaeon CG08_land_8_20_14_0_20_34_12]|nr:MAG: hypothetical protein COT15_01775 [Candidatus Diapherotrites archaeon CG08_land_8_20_14_0_20_34_12]
MFGEVISGLGRAKQFLEMPEYKKQFLEKLNFTPFPGTLNLKIDKKELKEFLQEREKRNIAGFEKDCKKFGDVLCYKIKIGNIPAAIVFPEKKEHANDVIEIISYVNITKQLRLKIGDKVRLQ